MTATYRRCLVVMQAAELQPLRASPAVPKHRRPGQAPRTPPHLICCASPCHLRVRFGGHCLQSPGPGYLTPSPPDVVVRVDQSESCGPRACCAMVLSGCALMFLKIGQLSEGTLPLIARICPGFFFWSSVTTPACICSTTMCVTWATERTRVSTRLSILYAGCEGGAYQAGHFKEGPEFCESRPCARRHPAPTRLPSLISRPSNCWIGSRPRRNARGLGALGEVWAGCLTPASAHIARLFRFFHLHVLHPVLLFAASLPVDSAHIHQLDHR